MTGFSPTGFDRHCAPFQSETPCKSVPTVLSAPDNHCLGAIRVRSEPRLPRSRKRRSASAVATGDTHLLNRYLRRDCIAPTDGLCFRATRWLAPWSLQQGSVDIYPGRTRLILAVLACSATWRTIGRWTDGTIPLPAYAARAMAAEITRQVEGGSVLVAELLAHAEAQDRRPGRAAHLLPARRAKLGW